MRPFFIIGLLILAKWLPAQSWSDAIIKHKAYDSLIRVVALNTAKVDSVKSDDSLVVTYFSIDGDVIKREKQLFRGQGCAYNKSTTYFDNKNRPVFIEYFEQPCLTEEERKIDNSFEKITYWYERFLYDSTDRVSSKIFWYPNVKARRFQYSYDENGIVSQQSWRIKDNEFWN